jgi:hypothetical protein
MWINPEVDLPTQLLDAQGQGTLVIFAGAGVSMGAPSHLPDFRGLADRIAAGMLKREGEEPEDRFLGRLEMHGVDVEGIARSILDRPGSAPTLLHDHLLALFSSVDAIRIVTTNFDRHFTTAAKLRFGADPDVFVGPAVPLGRDVSGLVYLHGSLATSRHPLILTDREFGRAYLSDGWATRMLLEMFNFFTVLFVGYSHRDPVMTYLARSLVPGSKPRYALTPPGEADWWRFLGVTPVEFPLRDLGDRFGALTAAVGAWATHANMGELEHGARIRDIVRLPPPLEPEIAAYIETVVTDPVRRRHFLQHARSPAWLRWAEEKGLLDPLFSGAETSDPTTYPIASWFAAWYAREHPGDALAVVQRRGLNLSSQLWVELTREVGIPPQRPEPHIFAKWAAILVRSARVGWGYTWSGFLLEGCRWPEDREAAVLLFEYSTRPYVVLQQPWLQGLHEPESARVSAELRLEVEEYHLDQAWQNVFRPHLDELHEALIPILTNHIWLAHHQLKCLGNASRTWDPLSFRRTSIEGGSHRMPGDFDFLVDAARDVVHWLLHHDSHRADAVIDEWARSEAPLLRRLAIHALVEKPNLEPSGTLARIAAEQWLYWDCPAMVDTSISP